MIDGPPRAARADDTFALARSFEAYGAVHVVDAVDVALLSRVRDAADVVFAERELLAQQGRLPEALRTDYLRRFAYLQHLELGNGTVDSLIHPVFREVARSYLQAEPEPSGLSHVREISPTRVDTHLPFHQDQTILKKKLVNVWIPLSACGVEAPGLEIVLGSWIEQLPVSPPSNARFAVEHAMIDPELVFASFGRDALWHPHFELGDAMLFSGATAHRTYATPTMNRGRMSIELRLI